MAIDNAVGQTYTNAQISIGSYKTDPNNSSNIDYTEAKELTPDSLYIRSFNSSNEGIGFTFSSGNSSTSGIGTLIANTPSGFVFTTTIAGTNYTFYVTNQAQPDNQSTTVLPIESSTSPIYQAPCYCPGTLIRTDRGDVAVEELQVGDRLVTVSGEVKAIRWIGTRAYTGRFLAANPAVRPVRFLAGSLGADASGAPLPSRDLVVSPKHAMLIDGALVPAELLVNNRTVVRDAVGSDVSYFHVELPEHDVIWAENVASESFVDDGSRGMFNNAASFASMYPDAATVEPVFCAPRVEGGEALEAIRRKLGAVAVMDERIAA